MTATDCMPPGPILETQVSLSFPPLSSYLFASAGSKVEERRGEKGAYPIHYRLGAPLLLRRGKDWKKAVLKTFGGKGEPTGGPFSSQWWMLNNARMSARTLPHTTSPHSHLLPSISSSSTTCGANLLPRSPIHSGRRGGGGLFWRRLV